MKNQNGILERYEKTEEKVGLKYGIIEVTTQCQLRCPGCYMVKRGLLNNQEMSLKQAIQILDLCHDYSGKELETMDILGGEPLLWSPLKSYIQELLRRGIKPWIFTNMLAITPELARWLYDHEVFVTGKLNVNPGDKNTWNLQAEMIGSSKKTVQKMFDAIQIFQEAGYKNPMFRLQNLLRKKNVELVPNYYRWCLENDIGTDLELMGSGEPIDKNYWKIAPTPQMLATMIKKIQTVREGFGLEKKEVLMPHVFGSCPFFDKGLYFGVDGHIRACSNSTVKLADVSDIKPIKKAYESDLICNRKCLTNENIGKPCRSCKKWEKCRGGCRATVEGSGDPFGGYSLCPVPLLKS
ncbi:MAG: radical SAM protein [Candidatus Gracilibacteria bacterium]|nr:radical SAM protein [Candidatus Gracilibacteria bacterium]